ncbi:TadG family pilus assembly protein, partial [Alienimonas sp. DA493]|uniref:TadG family pilus assembly protein n=1 Tax=Alienimonas sp. DA493 TaxID=3373605 RepID=UPI0037546664
MILPLAAALLVLAFAFLAFSIDVGYVAMTRGELQNAADAAALAGAAELADGPAAVRLEAQRIAAQNRANNDRVYVPEEDVSLGFWDLEARTFDPDALAPNAVKVITRRNDQGLLFGPVIGAETFDARTEAVAVVHPRDICFVVDLSGSMNDDTEVGWATDLLNDAFRGAGYPNIGTQLAEDLFEDLGFGEYPGRLEYVGGGLVPEDRYAYANLTKDDGPLANSAVPLRYRILPTDDEAVRKRKCYSALIDLQLRPLMPGVAPPADSLLHYAYWEKYLDYVIQGVRVGVAPPSPPRPPSGGGGGGGGPRPPSPPPRPTVGWLEEAFPHDLLNERPAGPGAEPAGLA